MLTKSTTVAVAALVTMLSLTLASAGAFAEQKGSGPTQGQIDCHNRAVNDYHDQVKACDQSLGDLPADNAQCKQDAYDDMRRTQRTQCGTIASIKQVQGVLGTAGGTVLDPGPGKTFTRQKLQGIGGTAGATAQ
jgi:hypothetical protein